MKTFIITHTPLRASDFWLFRFRPAQAPALRSGVSRALRSRAKKSEIEPSITNP